MKNALLKRFVTYTGFDTESKANQNKVPSTETQFALAKHLVDELKNIGLSNVFVDKHAYVYAFLPANVKIKETPTIGFIAHIDTSPDFTGKNVRARVWENYNGADLHLNDQIMLSPVDFPELKTYIGQTLITTDGTSLLGADDKAGVAEIVTAMEYLIHHPEIEHGNIQIAFTPDEEIGHGAALLDLKRFDATWAYTLDGGAVGELEYENFNAAAAEIQIKGKSIHPGYAKGKMINAIEIATKFMEYLPQKETPQRTSDYEGFFHVTAVKGSVDSAHISLIIRDHNFEIFQKRKQILQDLVKELNTHYKNDSLSIEMKDQYYNMFNKIRPVMHIVDIAKEAMIKAGITPKVQPIRGGTDGAALSYRGLPCPNLFAGGRNFHGPYEYISLESMEKAVHMIVNIAQLTCLESKRR